MFVCLDEFEACARLKVSPASLSYYSSGAVDETSLRWNQSDFSRLVLRPRVLRNVSTVSLATTILGRSVNSPVAIAPSAMHGLAHCDKEEGTARAAKNCGTLMVLSTYSNTSLEDVINAPCDRPLPSATQNPFWLQLYVHTDRRISEGLIRRAEKAGYHAIVLTVDAPVLGRRLNDLRNKFSMPPHLTLANFSSDQGVMTQSQRNSSTTNGGAKADATLTWSDIDWLRGLTSLKIVLKGIMTPEDATLACEYGVDAILVSNHGGRQLDTVASTISVLPEIKRAVDLYSSSLSQPTKCKRPVPEIYLDGGVRRGTDVVKALALGAKAVFLGRPVLWGLAVDGSRGVEAALTS